MIDSFTQNGVFPVRTLANVTSHCEQCYPSREGSTYAVPSRKEETKGKYVVEGGRTVFCRRAFQGDIQRGSLDTLRSHDLAQERGVSGNGTSQCHSVIHLNDAQTRQLLVVFKANGASLFRYQYSAQNAAGEGAKLLISISGFIITAHKAAFPLDSNGSTRTKSPAAMNNAPLVYTGAAV
jgi:hypothetical protein